ncbi:hypothetical protein [Chondromyces crocatus]|uniref:Uncharacterized protein n=1 Tax=Chondromyces crocatus TaxID=52 RepID=A0A0K1EG55_CHOCO|nr:hypothetical protein [Chondromyces crocatus]AKT39851.1 uncharacterized protein CMC5_040020 [Chondromyces crocatus]
MRSWLALLASCLFVSITAAGGCTGGDDLNADATVSVSVGGSTDTRFVCNGGRADGYCNARGGNPEPCECSDCTLTARCQQTCNNDGVCTYDPDNPSDEDCTCDDCYGSHPRCPPLADCNNNGTCEPNEGAGCGDCDDPSTTTTTTTSGTGGAGGTGGDGGAGGAGGDGGA